MKKITAILMVVLMAFALTFTGCQDNSEPTIDNKEIFDDDLQALSEEEMEELNNGAADEDMTTLDESEQDNLDAAEDEIEGEEAEEDTESQESTSKLEEDGTYTSKIEVASYVHTYGHLPSNYITKTEAKKLGWVSKEGNLDEVAPGKSIGGDKFGNYDKMLPVESGRKYYECDIDYEGGYRAEKRLIYSNDGLVFYTEDHYSTFEQLY